MTDSEVGGFLNDNFVSAYQKVGTFRIVNGAKVGGNVASYFCTPDQRVLHVIAGPVKADVFLREARWVNETWKLAMLDSRQGKDATKFKEAFRNAHAERLAVDHNIVLPFYAARLRAKIAKGELPPSVGVGGIGFGPAQVTVGPANAGRIHRLLATDPLTPLDQVYKPVFEQILGERISPAPVARQ